MVQIQIMSDLHLEAFKTYDTFVITPEAPYLALLGNIGSFRHGHRQEYLEFLERQLFQFKAVFYVLGMHELAMAAKASKEGEREMGEFVFLDNSRYDFRHEKVTVLGGTLFSLPRKDHRDSMREYYKDFMRIDGWDANQHFAAHKATCSWLLHTSTAIENEDPDRAIIILTHYCPSVKKQVLGTSTMYHFATDRKWLHRFMTDNVKLWAFGSTHNNCDYTDYDNGTRFYSNQRGFPGECEDFKISKTVEVGPIQRYGVVPRRGRSH
ncbi:hypothetical protein F5Y05DRAFT_409281 [Hypoxylon sp. FL0543]|nr:hypothetical protein F5Y05DRAFT_409281 [Hypoxylon sp. FL0543]